MKLIVYVMEACSTCNKREEAHFDLSERMYQNGIDFEAIKFGKIGQDTFFPLEEHDDLCRKPNDPMKYVTPVYILETDESILKLQDLGDFGDTQQYTDYVTKIAKQYMN